MLNTDAIHMAVFQDMMRPRGIEITEDYYMTHVHGRLNEDFFAEMMPEEPDPKGLSAAKEAEFRRRLPKPFPSMPGIDGLIQRAQDQGWPMAVVTNAMRLNAECMLDAVGHRDKFSTIVIGEECAKGKPDPEPYLTAMDALGVGPEVSIAFEDSPSGVRAAASSGAYTVGIRSSLSDDALRAAGADITIQDFNDPLLAETLRRFDRETTE